MGTILSPVRTILLVLFLLMIAAPAWAEIIILEVFVNQQKRGDYFVQLQDDTIYLRTEDAVSFELPGLDQAILSRIDGEDYLRVAQLSTVSQSYDERTLTLHLEIESQALPEREINLSPAHHSDTYFPQDDSFFINYGLALDAVDSFSPDSTDLTSEIGWRRGQGLFLTDVMYSKSPDKNTFARLQSRLIIDDRQRLRRWTYGDFQTEPTPFGSSVALGGVSLTRKFQIDPYYIHYPAIGYEGILTTPGEIEVYLDGVQVHKEELAPGRFVFNDLTRYGGAGELSVVVRDIFGHEEQITRPFYLDEQLLKAGDHEYSYSLGLLREDYGVESFGYGEVVLSGFHRYGWWKNLSVDLTGEVGRGLLMVSPRLLYIWGTRGLFDVSLATSVGSDKNGVATGLSYAYRTRQLGTSVRLKFYSEEFSTIVSEDRSERPASEIGLRFNYGEVDFGSFAFDFAMVRQHQGVDRDILGVSYSRRLNHAFSLHTSVRHTSQLADDTRVMLTLSYRPRTRPRMAFKIESFEGGNAQTVQWFKGAPEGEGYGYRVESERRSSEDATDNSIEHFWQYNTRYGIGTATAEYSKNEFDTEITHRLTSAGGVACVGGRCEATRPVRDSFGVVKVGDISGVRVMNNGQEIGRTDDEGILFIPNIKSFYENQLKINDQDIPMERSITKLQRYVSPPYRSGSCLFFPAVRFQPITGRLHIVDKDGERALEYAPVTMMVDGQPAHLESGRDGEFYLDPTEFRDPFNATSGGCDAFASVTKTAAVQEYQGVVGYNGKKYPFKLTLLESDDFYLDLGTIVIDVSGEPIP